MDAPPSGSQVREDRACPDESATIGPNTAFLLKNAAGLGLLGLVLIYIVGSLSLTGQFLHEGIDPRLGLSFYSIEQILVRGIGTVGRPVALILVAVYGFNFLMAHRPHLRAGDPPGMNLSRFRRGTAVGAVRWTGTLLFAFGFAYFLNDPWPGCLSYVPWVLVGWYLLKLDEAEARWYLFETKAWVYIPLATILLSTLLGTFLNPRPLEVAYLDLGSGDSLSGDLVARTPDEWVLAADEEGEVNLLPSRAVETARIEPGEPNEGDGITDFILNQAKSIL